MSVSFICVVLPVDTVVLICVHTGAISSIVILAVALGTVYCPLLTSAYT